MQARRIIEDLANVNLAISLVTSLVTVRLPTFRRQPLKGCSHPPFFLAYLSFVLHITLDLAF